MIRRWRKRFKEGLREWLGIAVNERRIFSHYNMLNDRVRKLEHAHVKALLSAHGMQIVNNEVVPKDTACR